MRQDNVQFLKDRLFNLGFGDNLHEKLENKIKEGPEKFTLSMPGEFGQGDKKKIVEYTLDFSKSKQEDMYFVNNYTAKLKGDSPEQDKSQKFFLNNGRGVTAKEAFNLLEGRAVYKDKLVNKEGDEYSAWLQLNFKEKDKHDNFKVQPYTAGWKYDLEKSLNRHPMKELANEDQKNDLLKSLKKGNLQPVTFTTDGKDVKMFVEANPKERSLNVYDEKMTKQFQGIRPSTSEIQEKSQGAQEKKTEDKTKVEKTSTQEMPEGRTRTKKRGMSV